MRHRLWLTLPLSVLLWACMFGLAAWCLRTPPAQKISGRDVITAHLIINPPVFVQPTPPPPPLPQQPARHTPRPAPKPKPQKPVPQPVPLKPQKVQEAQTSPTAAVVLYQPMPVIPEDLRHDVFSTTATATFHVTADGTATPTLKTPSQSPQLNYLLLEALARWRFKPATDGHGNPVASTFDIRVNFAVR